MAPRGGRQCRSTLDLACSTVPYEYNASPKQVPMMRRSRTEHRYDQERMACLQGPVKEHHHGATVLRVVSADYRGGSWFVRVCVGCVRAWIAIDGMSREQALSNTPTLLLMVPRRRRHYS